MPRRKPIIDSPEITEKKKRRKPVRKSRKSRKALKTKGKPSEITQLKKLIVKLIKKFDEDLAHEDFSKFWGEKESPVNAITKLSQILLKLLSVAGAKSSKKAFSDRMKEEFTTEDFAMLADYFSQQQSHNEQTYGNPG